MTTDGPRAKPLKFWGAIALSLSIMAPTLAMSLNGALPASLVGAAVPLTFLLSFVGVALVAYSFVRLTGRFHHAGSVYALVGATVGPRAGFFSGFGLLGVYYGFVITTSSATALFLRTLLERLFDVQVPWGVLAAIVLGLVAVLGTRPLRSVSRALITLEGLSVGLIIVLLVIVVAVVASGNAPDGQSFNVEPLTPGAAGLGAVFATTVFGFLSWAGFEGAATLGEETSDPRRNIPRAIWISVVALGIFYTACMYIQIIGFGTDAESLDAFATSGGTLADLAQTYTGSVLAALVNLGAVASAFASALGCATAGSRMLFAMSRDGFGPSALSRRNSHDIPVTAILAVIGTSALTMAALAFVPGGAEVTNQFFWSATIASLVLVVVYAMASVGLLVNSGQRAGSRGPLDIILPIVSIAFLAYVFWENRGSAPPYDAFPYVAAGWLLAGLVIVGVVPSLATRIGRGLMEDEGFPDTGRTETGATPRGGGAPQ